MEKLLIEPTNYTPKVELDPQSGILFLEGKSLPENVLSFYQPIIDWIENYIVEAKNETKVICNLDYINTTSSKLILDILIRLKKLETQGKSAKVEWHYDEDDEDIKDTGIDYYDIVGMPFDFLPN